MSEACFHAYCNNNCADLNLFHRLLVQWFLDPISTNSNQNWLWVTSSLNTKPMRRALYLNTHIHLLYSRQCFSIPHVLCFIFITNPCRWCYVYKGNNIKISSKCVHGLVITVWVPCQGILFVFAGYDIIMDYGRPVLYLTRIFTIHCLI